MKLTALGLATLLLTGCASSPSLESQTKLIHYQACLDHQGKIQQTIRDLIVKNVINFESNARSIIKTGIPNHLGLIPSLESMIEVCEKYLP